MYKTIDFSEFTAAFRDYGRSAQFSEDALYLIFGYIEDMETETGEQVELDVIAICCEYAERAAEQIAADYGVEVDLDLLDDPSNEEERAEALVEAVRDYLADGGYLVGESSPGVFVYVQH
jgi:hypothetical protein